MCEAVYSAEARWMEASSASWLSMRAPSWVQTWQEGLFAGRFMYGGHVADGRRTAVSVSAPSSVSPGVKTSTAFEGVDAKFRKGRGSWWLLMAYRLLLTQLGEFSPGMDPGSRSPCSPSTLRKQSTRTFKISVNSGWFPGETQTPAGCA